MKKLFTSTLLAAAAVPFLMAAPGAAKKVQNQAPSQGQTSTAKAKTNKKHAKKQSGTASSTSTDTSAPSSASPKK